MRLSQLLITPESFPSLPLAGTTLLKRARIWAEGDGEAPGWGRCVQTPRGPQSSAPLPGGSSLLPTPQKKT